MEWQGDEIQKLAAGFDLGLTVAEIADEHGRS